MGHLEQRRPVEIISDRVGTQMRPGTKTAHQIPVIVVDETAINSAIAQLQTAGINVQKNLP
jgi:hypothetical protein